MFASTFFITYVKYFEMALTNSYNYLTLGGLGSLNLLFLLTSLSFKSKFNKQIAEILLGQDNKHLMIVT